MVLNSDRRLITNSNNLRVSKTIFISHVGSKFGTGIQLWFPYTYLDIEHIFVKFSKKPIGRYFLFHYVTYLFNI